MEQRLASTEAEQQEWLQIEESLLNLQLETGL
jgi:hypothetical protein